MRCSLKFICNCSATTYESLLGAIFRFNGTAIRIWKKVPYYYWIISNKTLYNTVNNNHIDNLFTYNAKRSFEKGSTSPFLDGCIYRDSRESQESLVSQPGTSNIRRITSGNIPIYYHQSDIELTTRILNWRYIVCVCWINVVCVNECMNVLCMNVYMNVWMNDINVLRNIFRVLLCRFPLHVTSN